MKKILLLTIALFVALTSLGQSCDFTLNEIATDSLCTLTDELVQGDAALTARDKVALMPGFTANSEDFNGNTLTISTNHTLSNQTNDYISSDDVISGTSSTHTLDQSSCIPGTVGGSVNVSPTGAATYQIPIQVSPGSHGMQPNLSIVYSSQSGNGLLGWGWNLAGLSSISRENKSQYYDGETDAISLSSTSTLILDGVRLIRDKSDTSKYYPANNPYIQVTFNSSSSYFTVTKQNGTVMEYGKEDNSRVILKGHSVPISWAISRITDPNGNFIRFIYTGSSTSEYRINEIKYTGNSMIGQEPYNSIKFYYDKRTDASTMYMAGGTVKQSVLLTGIRVFCEGSLSKEYGFTYFYNQYSKLNTVSLTADGVTYNPTVVDWGESISNLAIMDTIPQNIPNDVWGENIYGENHFGDFNGDGIIDIARVDSAHTTISVGIASLSGSYNSYTINLPVYSIVTTSDEDYKSIKETNIYVKYGIQIVDYNNDGKEEIMYHYSNKNIIAYVPNPKSTYGYSHADTTFLDLVDAYSFNDTGFTSKNTFIDAPSSQTITTKFYYNDIDNDGLIEQIIVKDRALYSCTGVTLPTLYLNDINDLQFVDSDGDGQQEVLVIKVLNAFLLKFSNTSLLWYKEIDWETDAKFAQTGDFNGDGITDFLSVSNESIEDECSLYINFFDADRIYFWDFPVSSSDPIAAFLVVDIDNDGRSEIIITKKNVISVVYYNGNSFYVRTISSIESGKTIKYLRAVDLDNDGVKELVYRKTQNSQPRLITLNSNLINNRFVKSITDGLGNTSTFSYSLFTDNRIFSASFPKPSLPLILLRGPMRVVNNLTTTSGSSTWANTDYTYADGYLHLHGLGFLGFKTLTATDQLTSTKATSNYSYTIDGATGIYSPWLTNQTSKRGGITTSVTNTMEAMNLGTDSKSFVPVVTSSTSVDGFKCITTTTTTTFDESIGRITGQTISAGAWTATTTNTYTQVSGYVYKPSSTVVSRSNGSDTHTETTTYNSYSTTYPFVPTSITNNGLTTTYTVSSYGNIVGTAVGSRTTSRQFDGKGRFVVSSTDVTGYTSTATYRSCDGAKLSETDPNSLTTTYSYTPGGGSLITKANLPDGRVVTKTLGWSSDDYLYYASEGVSYGATTTTYLNAAGQKMRVSTNGGFNGATLYTDYTYNADGSLSTETRSGYPATSYTYQDDGRLKSVSGINTSISYGYSGTTVTATDNNAGTTQTKTYDPLGNVTGVSGTNGDIAYTYFASGRVKKIVAEGSTTSMTYDSRGNQLTLVDPDAETTTYTYNGFDQLLTQKDAKGVTTTCTYDASGRLTAKTATGLSEAFTYGTTTGQLGLMLSHTRDGVTEAFTYDALCRPLTTTVTGDSKTFTTTRTYNSKAQLYQVAYPSGLTVQYRYDDVGNLASITDVASSVVLWSGTTKNDRDQWTKFTLGNGLITQWGYASDYQLSTIKTGTTALPTSVQNLGFTFNTVGQLTGRTDGSLSESFGYDLLNRLTSSTVGSTTYTYAYSDNGNISSTSLAGDYTYSSDHPHAVEEVAGTGGVEGGGSATASTYTADNKISTIDDIGYKNTFAYGPSGGRFKMSHYVSGSLVRSKIYTGSSEFVYSSSGTLVCRRTLVYAPTGICAVYQDSASSQNFYYIHTDYLGSWLAITNSSGSLTNRYSYDAWGRPRDPDTWALKEIDITSALVSLSAMQPRFDRGYTGHEHLCDFSLINMNGRLYDPYLQRFLSPDSYVQSPGNAQSYNRYTYCLNNPMKYIDPSGWQAQAYFDTQNDYEQYCRSGGGQNIYLGVLNTYSWEGCGLPGQGYNGYGLNGVYYDWFTGTYRSVYDYSVVGVPAITQADIFSSVSGDGAAVAYRGLCSSTYSITLQDVTPQYTYSFTGGVTELAHVSEADLDWVSPQGSVPLYSEVPAGGGGWLETANNYSGIATTLITGGTETTNAIVRGQFKSATSWTGWTNLRNSQQAWRTANVLGKTGAMTLKCVSTTGGVLGGLSASYSTYKVGNQIYNGGLSSVNGWDLADASVGWAGTASAVMLFLGTSNPVGWAAIGIGAAGYGLFRAGQYVYENY